MYKIEFDIKFSKSYKKVIKGNQILEKQFLKVTKQLSEDPKYPSLKSHKVDIINQREVWVSSVSGDIRLAWVYSKDGESIIICLKLGTTHSGANQIYTQTSA